MIKKKIKKKNICKNCERLKPIMRVIEKKYAEIALAQMKTLEELTFNNENLMKDRDALRVQLEKTRERLWDTMLRKANTEETIIHHPTPEKKIIKVKSRVCIKDFFKWLFYA